MLRRALVGLGHETLLAGHRNSLNDADFSPDGAASGDRERRPDRAHLGRRHRRPGHDPSPPKSCRERSVQPRRRAGGDSERRPDRAGLERRERRPARDPARPRRRFVRSAEFSPDGERVLTASDDGTARIWDADSGAQLQVLRGHEGRLDERRLQPRRHASGDRERRPDRADLGRRQRRRSSRSCAATDSEVDAAAFSPDGERVVTASWDKTRGSGTPTAAPSFRSCEGMRAS